MDKDRIRKAFDEQLRRRPPEPESPGSAVENDGPVTRVITTDGDWSGVTWTGLSPDGSDADDVIAAQISRFATLPGSWEWKHYSYDQPSDLPDRLLAAGFAPEPAETLLVAEIADLDLEARPPAGVELRDVVTEDDVSDLVAVHDVAFGGEYSATGRTLLADLARRPSPAAAVLAVADGRPVSAGRLEFHAGTEFASLWGGGTAPEWRRRGIFRALVAHRAALASTRGFRYLQVDATDDSRPILVRLGFIEIATTTPFIHGG